MSPETYWIEAGPVTLQATLTLPPSASGVVVISQGGAAGCHSPGNRHVAEAVLNGGLGTLLPNLLLPAESADQEACFDVDLLSARLQFVVRWAMDLAATRGLPIGLFGASTAAASALRVAADMPDDIGAVVSRRGRPELVGAARLSRIRCPTLLLVGDGDRDVIGANELAQSRLTHCERRLLVLPRAGQPLGESGVVAQMAELATLWFARYLPVAAHRPSVVSGVA